MSDCAYRLEVRGLTVRLGSSRAPVVHEVSFALRGGKTLGLVGESGAGKSTVALALLGYARRGLQISAGQVLLDGENVLGLEQREAEHVRGSRVAYVPQDPGTALNPALRVGTQIREVLAKQRNCDDDRAAWMTERLGQVLREVRLSPEVVSAYPHQLSGGQQQRVVLAMAFALRPAVIVLDEPTTGLDVTTQRHVLKTIQELCTAYDVTGVFVSHDLALVGEVVDDILVLYAGETVEYGSKSSVLGCPSHPYTRALIRAVPSPTISQRLVGLAGQPPQPERRPTGCTFAPRCSFAEDRCSRTVPGLVDVLDDQHLARCIRLAELPPLSVSAGILRAGDITEADREMPVISVDSLCASYDGKEVLRDINVGVGIRRCVAVVGESGSGKTTLARCIVGLHRSWAGEIRLDGHALAPSSRERPIDALRAVQYVFQNPYASLNPRRTVAEIVEQPLRFLFKLSLADRMRRVEAALEGAAISTSFLPRVPGELSGGERQRVALARALVVEPKVLVCDEVTSALDVSVQAAIIDTLRRLQEERDLALLFITHNLALVRSIAQDVMVIEGGHMVERGETNAVLDHPTAEYTQQLLVDVPKPYGGDRAVTAGSGEVA